MMVPAFLANTTTRKTPMLFPFWPLAIAWLPFRTDAKYQGPRPDYAADGTAEPEQHRLFREALTPRPPKKNCND
jgi:hypothetical protein